MNIDLLIPYVFSFYIATAGGFATVALTNNGCTNVAIEHKSMLLGSVYGFLFIILYSIISLMFLKNYGEAYISFVLPLISVFLGALGGLAGHLWHERWERNNGVRARPFDMGMLDSSPQQIKEAHGR